METENVTTEDPVELENENQPNTEEPGGIVESPPTEEPAPIDGVQKRINELTKKRREAEKDAAYWKGRAEVVTTQPIPVTPPAEIELDPNDFDTDADYLREVAKQVRDEIKTTANSVARKQQLSATQAQISEAYDKARGKNEDFDEVALNPGLPITQSMFDAAVGDNMGDVLYHLGKHPDIASKIASLSPIQQAKEIGRIEDRLSKPTPPKKKTGAPDPPTVISGGGSPAPKSEAEMNRTELHAKWNAERKKNLGVK